MKKDVFKRQPEEMTRIIKWVFGLPIAYIIYICISTVVPSFGTTDNAIMLRNAVLELILTLSVLVVAKYFLRFKIINFFYEDEDFGWGHLFMAMGVMMFMNLFTSIIWHALSPEDFELTFNPENFSINWICSFILIVSAALAEEVIFRSYIAFFLHDEMETRPKYMYVYCVVSGLIFALSHFKNPEVLNGNTFWSVLFYCIFGAFLMFFSLATHGCEVAFGIHIGNNLVSAWFFSYDDSVLKTNALFTHHNNVGPLLIFQTLICLYACSVFVKHYHTHPHKLPRPFYDKEKK